MLGEMAAFAQSVKALSDILNGLKSMSETVGSSAPDQFADAVNTQLVEANRIVMAAQESALVANAAQATLVQKVADLEATLVQFETWEREKARYRLVETAPRAFAYRLNETEVARGEPLHHICPHCYEQRRKSILQANPEDLHSLRCPACQTEIAYPQEGLSEQLHPPIPGPYDDDEDY